MIAAIIWSCRVRSDSPKDLRIRILSRALTRYANTEGARVAAIITNARMPFAPVQTRPRERDGEDPVDTLGAVPLLRLIS